MKKSVLLSVTVLLLGASTAGANGLNVAWTACPGTANAVKTQVFDCDPNLGSVYELMGGFSLTSQAAQVVAMDGIMDVRFEGQTNVPPFWEFQTGGCNEAGISLQDARPSAAATGCVAAFSNTLCGTGGTACDPFLTAYGLNWTGPGTARLLFTLARASSSPVVLAAEPTKHFAFNLGFAMDFSGTCASCNIPVSLVWNMAVLYSVSPQTNPDAVAAVISSTDPASDPCININGGTQAGCSATPTRRSTWGALKSLYR